MTVKSSGSLSFSDIRAEFGGDTSNISLGSYRISQTLDSISATGAGGTFYPLADGMPLPGQQIKMSDFYNKKKTIIIEYKSSMASLQGRSLLGDFNNRINLSPNLYQAYIISPSSTALSPTATISSIGPAKVVVSIAGSLGSRTTNRTNCALNIDTNFGNNLIIEIGPNATISGGGGNGGNGGGVNQSGNPGISGGSALGISVTGISTIRNRGTIQWGTSGGGGGGGYRTNSPILLGGGGGGGAGYPPGNGGTGGKYLNTLGFSGQNGTISLGGTGGQRVISGSNYSGAGGIGGSTTPSSSATAGTSASRGGSAGAAGQNGYRMVVALGVPTPVITPITYGIKASSQIGTDITGTNPTI